MNKKSRDAVLCSVIFFCVCFALISCKARENHSISLSEETVTEGVSEGDSAVLQDSGHAIGQDSTSKSGESSDDVIFIYVTGQVKNPGVYEVSADARVYSVIELAGGFTSKASRESMNLAEKLSDGQHIHVISKSQYKKMVQDAGSDTIGQSTKDKNADTLVDINKATEEELMQLPGIGESKAQAIISYRQDCGSFQTIEDIMLVPGIKEGAYEKIKLLIKV